MLQKSLDHNPKNEDFPLVVSFENIQAPLAEFLVQEQEVFKSMLLKHGAILFRGFSVDSVEKFEHIMSYITNEKLEYGFRSSPRYAIGEGVYVSTTYPEDQKIHMHSESSYSPIHPKHIVFCCITRSETGGETPISDNRKVMKLLDPRIRDKFIKLGVKYVRTLDEFIGLPWQEVFQTNDKQEVEQECTENEIQFEWINDNKLKMSWSKKGVWEHYITGETVWFNHAAFFNKHCLDPDIMEFLKSNDSLPYDTYYGDGSEISKPDIEEIHRAYKSASVMFPWQEGDVLFLDNMLSGHGRNSYSGDRKIIVSIY
jgi:alpha-ketoglutarate-dependent taurine dioxygenase